MSWLDEYAPRVGFRVGVTFEHGVLNGTITLVRSNQRYGVRYDNGDRVIHQRHRLGVDGDSLSDPYGEIDERPDDMLVDRGPDEYCDHCGQKIRKLNPHGMDASKVSLLQQIAALNSQGHEWVKIQQDTSLIVPAESGFTIQCDAVHASRLKWFGLLTPRRNVDGGTRTGYYRVNGRGVLFLSNRRTVPKRIACRSGRVIRKSIERVHIGAVRGVVLDIEYWNNYADEQGY